MWSLKESLCGVQHHLKSKKKGKPYQRYLHYGKNFYTKNITVHLWYRGKLNLNKKLR